MSRDAVRLAVGRLSEAASVAAKWRSLRRTVSTLETELSAAFTTQGRLYQRALRVLEGKAGWTWAGSFVVLREDWTPDDWLTIFDRVTQETTRLFFTPIQEGSSAAMTLAAEQMVATLGVDVIFNLSNPRAVAYLEAHGFGLISQIDAVTRGNIATIVTNGVAEGWSYDRIAREIAGLYRQMAIGMPQQHIDSRAHLIAVTEAGNAYEAGNRIVVDDLVAGGLQIEKKWLTVGDERVSAGCRENAQQGWIPVEQAFSSGHQQPLRFPGCRCTTLYRRRR